MSTQESQGRRVSERTWAYLSGFLFQMYVLLINVQLSMQFYIPEKEEEWGFIVHVKRGR